jgi:aminopeptidase YwaD
MSTTGVAGLDDLLALVSPDRMAATVEVLAGDRFAGRRVGTAGNAAAREWLTDRFRADGATVTTETFTVPAVPEVYERPVVRWNGVDLAFGRDVAVHLASTDLPDPREGLLGVAGRDDPDGRWLLVPAGMSLFDAYGHAYRAAGLLLPRGVDADGWQFTMLAGPGPGPLPILTVETGLHRRMLAGHDGGPFVANAPIRRIDVTGTNLHARYHTGEPELLLTAHHDGVGDHPGLRQPSAADNGSGVAVACEAARLLAPALPAGVGLSVALVDGEEVGALGSARHAEDLRDAGAAPLVLNVDGAGRLDGAVAVEAGGPAHALLAVLDQAGRHTRVPLVAGPVASDNRRYAAAGLAAIGLGAGMAGYHSPADTADRVDPATLTAVARLVVATVWLAARSGGTLSSSIGDER